MNAPPWLTAPHLLEAGGWLALAVWTIYKKELQDWLKGCCKRCYARWFQAGIARRVTEAELKDILSSGLVGLETLLLLLLKEYTADRVTVMEYSERAGSHVATCVVEVREADMPSIQHLFQRTPLAPGLWAALEHIHAQPGRWRYVADARTEDNVPLRAVLTSSGVCSAYYQSLPSPEGQPVAMLAVSWARAHELTAAEQHALRNSGIACGTVWRLMAAWKPASTA